MYSLVLPLHYSVAGYNGFILDACVFINLSYVLPSIFCFRMSKHHWIFTKLGMHIDIVEIWFGIAWAHFVNFWQSYLPTTHPYFCFRMITWVNFNELSPSDMGIDFMEIWIANGQFPSSFGREQPVMSVFSFLDYNFNKYQWIFIILVQYRSQESLKVLTLQTHRGA